MALGVGLRPGHESKAGCDPQAGPRLALVIGNSAYRQPEASLDNPGNDALAIAVTLKSLGFGVDCRFDLSKEAMRVAIAEFRMRITGTSTVVFYFAGHGAFVEEMRMNLLVPIDFECTAMQPTATELIAGCVSLAEVLDASQRAARTLVLLDKCRDNPSKPRGFGASMPAPFRSVAHRGNYQTYNALIAYGADENQRASDGSGQNSPFTEALLDNLGEPHEWIYNTLGKVRSQVSNKTGGKQSVFFEPRADNFVLWPHAVRANRPERSEDHDHRLFAEASYLGTPEALSHYLSKYSRTGKHCDEAADALNRMKRVRVDAPILHNASDALFLPGAGETEWFKDHAAGPEMVVVPGWEPLDADAASRLRSTAGNPPFAVSRTPVTFAQWEAAFDGVAQARPDDNGWGGGQRPVINVSWRDCERYLLRLLELTGKRYRLLSEAEWEFCCRAGTQTTYWTGESISMDQARFSDVEGPEIDRTIEVGGPAFSPYLPNPFGLFDMHGNVWEWCQDSWRQHPPTGILLPSAVEDEASDKRVARGGAWVSDKTSIASSSRQGFLANSRKRFLGFRVARDLDH